MFHPWLISQIFCQTPKIYIAIRSRKSDGEKKNLPTQNISHSFQIRKANEEKNQQHSASTQKVSIWCEKHIQLQEPRPQEMISVKTVPTTIRPC